METLNNNMSGKELNLEAMLSSALLRAIEELYQQPCDTAVIQVQKTRKEFEGDYTLVTFPLLKISKKSPEQTANEIGSYLEKNVSLVQRCNVVKGFLNIKFQPAVWVDVLNRAVAHPDYGTLHPTGKHIMVEYSSPNTNKPLHLGHIRNNLLGYSVAEILQACGNRVTKVNLVNDRGIHICKSMLAWQKFGQGETPEKSGKKGDHLVGEYYVKFDQAYKAEIRALMAQGQTEEQAKKQAPMMLEAQEMLRKWEANDAEVVQLWKTMNAWVYAGFDATYHALGVHFDHYYYESNTYLLGKEIVAEGLEKGVFEQQEDGSVWIDLTEDGLDRKLVQRGDGTSVYITQDLGTALQRFNAHHLDSHIYVVGNEQNYHFQVLKLILKKLGHDWADQIYHLSYGMVELPEGKMKSREGTVVDADDLVDEMVTTARNMSAELGKLDGLSEEQAKLITRQIGLAALKYFILKVDPKKTMLFDPKESIDFNGNTGPFIQYTHARIQSLLRKAAEQSISLHSVREDWAPEQKEIELIKWIGEFPAAVQQAGQTLSPSVIAAYCYDLAKEFNQFYHDYSILGEADSLKRNFRLVLSGQIAKVLQKGMGLLGIMLPERM